MRRTSDSTSSSNNNQRTSQSSSNNILNTPPSPMLANSSSLTNTNFLSSPNSNSSNNLMLTLNSNTVSNSTMMATNSFNNKRWGLSPSASSLLSLDLQTMSHQTPILHSLLASPNSNSLNQNHHQQYETNSSATILLLDEVLLEDHHENEDDQVVNKNNMRSCTCCEMPIDQTIIERHAKENDFLCKYFFKVLPTHKVRILTKQQKDLIMEDQLLDDVLTSEEEDDENDLNNEPNSLDAHYLNLISSAIQKEVSSLERPLIFNHVVTEPFWRLLESSIIYSPDNCQNSTVNDNLTLSTSPNCPTSPGTLMMKIYSSSTTSNYANNSSLVHIAAKHNRVEILEWLKSCCCDQECNIENDSHSAMCISRQITLWNLKDYNGSTPLFCACQGCPTSTANEAGVFLMSQMQTLDPLSKYIHQTDNYGNSPLSLCMRKRDWKMCDLLILFGASIDGNTGAFGESLLHTSMRDLDMLRVEFIAKRAPKALLKKNQKEENALFSLVKDFRCNVNAGRSFILGSSDFSTMSTNIAQTNCTSPESPSPTSPYSETKSALRSAVNRAFPKEQRINFIRMILESGSSVFGREVFEKALSLKNQHGRNFLLESVACGDHIATKEIVNSLSILSLVAEECCSDPRKLMESIVFTNDRNSKNILHLSIEFATKRMNQHNREDYQTWLDSFYFLLSWLDENLAYGALFNRECTGLLSGKDSNGLFPHQYLEKEVSNNQSDIRWKNVLEIMKSYESKWTFNSKGALPSNGLSNNSKRGSTSKKQSIFSFLTSHQPSEEIMTPKKIRQLSRKSGNFTPKKPVTSEAFSKDSALLSESKDKLAAPLKPHKESFLTDHSTLYSNSSQSIVSTVSNLSSHSNATNYSEPSNRTQKLFSGIMKKLTGKNKSYLY